MSDVRAWIQRRANELQAQGPDEFPTGYYIHLAEEEIKQAAQDAAAVMALPGDVTEDEKRAIEQLDAMCGEDPEAEHDLADGILLGLVAPKVAEAWKKANARAGFWYA